MWDSGQKNGPAGSGMYVWPAAPRHLRLKAHAASPMPVGRTRPSPALSRPQLRQGPGNPPRSFTCSQATWAITSSCAHISASCSPQPLQTRSENTRHLARERPPRFLASAIVWATVSQRGAATLRHARGGGATGPPRCGLPLAPSDFTPGTPPGLVTESPRTDSH